MRSILDEQRIHDNREENMYRLYPAFLQQIEPMVDDMMIPMLELREAEFEIYLSLNTMIGNVLDVHNLNE
jgi:hypothetical protein